MVRPGMPRREREMNMNNVAGFRRIAFAHGAPPRLNLHGAEVDLIVSVGRFNGPHELTQCVFLLAYRLQNKAITLNTHFHKIVDTYPKAFEHRGGQADGRTIPPFTDDSTHAGSPIRIIRLGTA